MNRRGFLKGLGLVVGGIAIDKAIPFNRVWSFPKDIKIVRPNITCTWKLVDDWSDSDSYSVILTPYDYPDTYALIIDPNQSETAKKILLG